MCLHRAVAQRDTINPGSVRATHLTYREAVVGESLIIEERKFRDVSTSDRTPNGLG